MRFILSSVVVDYLYIICIVAPESTNDPPRLANIDSPKSAIDAPQPVQFYASERRDAVERHRCVQHIQTPQRQVNI
jgi:hypothetical protein